MAYLSREEYMKLQQRRQERTAGDNDGKHVTPFFSLKDGEETVVRFAYSDMDQMFNDLATVHQELVDNKTRNVMCLRKLSEPIDKCPLCKAGHPIKQRVFIRLLEYTREEDGSITATPRIWDRPANGPSSYINLFNNLFVEYGDISDFIFKIRRTGSKLDTTYSILPANPAVYNSQLYPKDFSAFENYNVLGSWALLDKTADEMNTEFLGVTEAPTLVSAEPEVVSSWTPPTGTTPRTVSW